MKNGFIDCILFFKILKKHSLSSLKTHKNQKDVNCLQRQTLTNSNGCEILREIFVWLLLCFFCTSTNVYKRKMCYPIHQLCTWKQRHRKEIWLHTYFQITSLHGDVRTQPQTLYTLQRMLYTTGVWREVSLLILSFLDVLEMSSLGWNLKIQSPRYMEVFH